MDFDKLAFTGSTATGRAILKASAASNLKKVILSLAENHRYGYFLHIGTDEADPCSRISYFRMRTSRRPLNGLLGGLT